MRRSLTLYLAAMAVILLLGIFEALAHWWVLLVVAGVAGSYLLGRRHACQSKRMWPRPVWHVRHRRRVSQSRRSVKSQG